MDKSSNENASVDTPSEGRIRARYFDKNTLFIYLSHLLSSFGDRIWQFAVGLYLYYLYPCSLMLTAVYGLATCGSLFLFGAPVGRWVDKSKRLEAARITIAVQNAAVVFSAAIMASTIYFNPIVSVIWDGKFEICIYVVIITIEIIGELASMANKLVLEKDWIVVLAGGDNQKLSCLNATMRTINLACKLLAPCVVGNLLDRFSYVTGAIFIASWNVASAFVEFYLLHIIFSVVPELALKSKTGRPSGAEISPIQTNVPVAPLVHDPTKRNEKSAVEPPAAELSHKNTQQSNTHCAANVDVSNNNNTESSESEANGIPLNAPLLSMQKIHENESKVGEAGSNNNNGDDGRLRKLWNGWKIYFSHPVKFAGVGLASLYMTVLSFDSVSIGYLSSQGVSAGLSGNMTAVAALVGILGSLSFPFVRKKLGRNKAGIFGFTLETLCLLLCVLSIVAPGSPFVPSSILQIFTNARPSCKSTSEAETSLSLREQWEKHSNVLLLVAGIVFARYGLWIADLSVTQIFQEKVKEQERGVMGGVQGSLNQLMSLVKFGLTILLPFPETFGYLICLSWFFVFLGWMFFMTFVSRDQKQVHKRSSINLELESQRNEVYKQ